MYSPLSVNKITALTLITLLINGCAINTDRANKQKATDTPAVVSGFSQEKVTPEHGNAVSRYYHAEQMSREALQNHNQAAHIFSGMFLRDPYIMQGPDGYFYYTGTRLNNILGGGKFDYQNEGVEIWRSKNLADWELLGVPVRLKDFSALPSMLDKLQSSQHNNGKPLLWAPELHFINNKWYITHTTNAQQAGIWVADEVMGPYREVMEAQDFGHRHDPTLYQDDDDKNYLLYRAVEAVEMNEDFSEFVGKKWNIKPSDRNIGHEGTYVIKIDSKYVIFGTAWSTDEMRHGSYNLYYTTADSLKGPFSERKWAGRFLGHGTPFQDKQGRWWITAFSNGKYFTDDQLSGQKSQSDNAYTIIDSGAYLVPLDIYVDAKGDVKITVKDERFSAPGPEEVQHF